MSIQLRTRKDEIEELILVLDQEWGDVGDLAGAVFKTVASQVTARKWWITVVVYPDAMWLHGPYATRKQAEDALISTAIAPKAPEARVFIRQIVTATASMEDGEQLELATS